DKKRTNKTKQPLLEKLETYRKWLLQLTICDPACGSGAFLNQALDFLINEHRYVDELQAKLFGDAMVLSDIENSILENNLFGVDLNEESVEIAKLSLWLRTAQPNRKLNDLSNNIKCGNSLIDDPEVAGEKAFNWFLEFPKVFPHYKHKKEHNKNDAIRKEIIKSGVLNYPDQGDYDYMDEVSEPSYSYKTGSKGFEKYGFDVVIGNPPYVNIANIQNKYEREFYQINYKTVKNKSDLYSIFTELGYKILKKDGLLSFIFSNSWLGTDSFSKFREFLINNTEVKELIKLPSGVFQDAIVTTVILLFKKKKVIDNEIILKEFTDNQFVKFDYTLDYSRIKRIDSYTFSFAHEISFKINTVKLGDITTFSLGVKTSDDKRFILKNKIDEDCYPMLRGRQISKYYYPNPIEWIWYKPDLMMQKDGAGPRKLEYFMNEKIFIQDVAQDIIAFYCDEFILSNDTLSFIYNIDKNYSFKFILALLNSKLINTWFLTNFQAGLHIKINQLQQIPIPIITILEQLPFIEKADQMLSLKKELQELSQKFQRSIQRKFELEDLPNKLQDWYKLSYSEFIKELAKKKVKLSLSQEAEWEDYFMQESKKALELKATIDATDKEIDKMVYELYG
ncbi:MAG: Eco57I restriction-modification methylase domain-containing protein, partial [Bacteroidales bacterium]